MATKDSFWRVIVVKALVQLIVIISAFLGLNASLALADTPCTGHVVQIGAVANGGVLYKPSNLHGGRGPTFLVQNAAERTNKTLIQIRNARCEVIAAFGLFKTDAPYGARYYMATGGTGQNSDELLRLAKLVGSTNILVEGVNGKWIRIKNPNEREGSVRK